MRRCLEKLKNGFSFLEKSEKRVRINGCFVGGTHEMENALIKMYARDKRVSVTTAPKPETFFYVYIHHPFLSADICVYYNKLFLLRHGQ